MIGQSRKTNGEWLFAWGIWTAALLALFGLVAGWGYLLINWHLALIGALFLGGIGVVAIDMLDNAAEIARRNKS